MTNRENTNAPWLTITSDWFVQVAAGAVAMTDARAKVGATTNLAVAPAVNVTVTAERYAALPLFAATAAGWAKGEKLRGVTAQETTAKDFLEPDSLVLAASPGGEPYVKGRDYDADLEWGTFGRLPGGRLGEGQPVYVSYRHGLSRLDTIAVDRAGRAVLRSGAAHPAVPRPPALGPDETALANVWVPGRVTKLGPDHLFPILEAAYPEPPPVTPSTAERLLPQALRKLQRGEHLRLLAWGDSVTDAGYLPAPERWQAQLVARLRQQFPTADLEPVTEAWGGRNTDAYLAEPPGSVHNYQERVLGAKPDLIVSEFVNDSWLKPDQVEERYGRLLADFRRIGAEWVILEPHYMRPDWMGLTRERDVDDDPRPYVAGLRQFAPRHGVALTDVARRWGRLWRQGLPYTTLLLNAINHPDARGMKLFADSVMALLPRA